MQVAVDRCCKALGYETSRCRFDFVEDEDIDVASYLDYAAKLQSMGATIDMQKLKDLVKLDFIKDDVADIWMPKPD